MASKSDSRSQFRLRMASPWYRRQMYRLYIAAFVLFASLTLGLTIALATPPIMTRLITPSLP